LVSVVGNDDIVNLLVEDPGTASIPDGSKPGIKLDLGGVNLAAVGVGI
jgi:hypothetical protein